MSATTRVGTALAAGYFLGRFKKLRLALIVGSALTNGKVRSSGLNLLQQGTGKLTSSPQGQELGKQISEQLLQAGRSAAMTMASSGVDRLSDSLRDRSERLRGGEASEEPEDEDEYAEDEPEDEEPEDEYAEDEPEEEPEDEYAEDEPEDEEPQDELEEEPPAPRRRRRAASRAGGGR